MHGAENGQTWMTVRLIDPNERKKMLTTSQAATRLRSDNSTVGKYIRRGLANGKLKLRGKKVNATHGGKRWMIDAAEVKRFAAERKRLGL